MSSAVVNNVRLVPHSQPGTLLCHESALEWTTNDDDDSQETRTKILLGSVESVFIDKASQTVLLTVHNGGFKLFQLSEGSHVEAVQNWLLTSSSSTPDAKLIQEQNSPAYASFVNLSLRSTTDATFDVFEVFAQVPRRLKEIFAATRETTRPRRQAKTIPTNPWIAERPLQLQPSQMTPGSASDVAAVAVDLDQVKGFQKCSALVYNSGASVLQGKHGLFWKRWSETQPSANYECSGSVVPQDVLGRLEKDLPRLGTRDTEAIDLTRRILIRTAQCFPEIGYVQGMADLALPFARFAGQFGTKEEKEVEKEEEETIEAFLKFFSRFKNNFSPDSTDMSVQLETLYTNVQALSPILADWLGFNRDCRALLFAYRWLLVLLRREMTAEEVDSIWSVMMAAETVKGISMQKYLLVFCTAMIISRKQELLDECSRFEDVVKVMMRWTVSVYCSVFTYFCLFVCSYLMKGVAIGM